MKKKFISTIFYTVGTIGVALALLAALPQKNMQKVSTEQILVTNSYFDKYLQQQEETIWQKLNTIGITVEEFQKRCQEYKHQCEQSPKPTPATIDPVIKKRLAEILANLKLNINDFIIITYEDNSAVAYAQNIILINESRFKELPDLAQQFAVAHEMQHLIYEDDIGIPVLEDWTKELSEKYPEAVSLFNEYSRFTEERADIKTALISEEFAKGYVCFFETRLKQNGDTAGITHPKNSERLSLANRIYNNTAGASV